MDRLNLLLDTLIEDVNKEDGNIIRLFERILSILFSLIKWAGVPFVVYLLLEITRW
jgi:hypothetical protein